MHLPSRSVHEWLLLSHVLKWSAHPQAWPKGIVPGGKRAK